MKIKYHLLIVVGLVALTSARIVDRISEQQQDYSVFSKVLLNKEGTLDMHLSSDSVNYYLEILRRDLQTEKSSLEQFKLYSEMVARLNCGHTQVLNNRKVQTEWLLGRQSLPIDVYLIGRRLVVGEIVDEDYDNIERDILSKNTFLDAGTEILMIDSLTVPEMMEGMGRYLSSDEGSMDFKYFQASQMFEFYRHLAFPLDKDSVMVQYVTPAKDTNTVFMHPGTAPVYSINARLNKASSEYNKSEADMGKFKIVNGQYGYFKFPSFSASAGSDYENFLKRSFQKLKAQNIDKLIVDLRGNTGGVMQYDFIKYFVGEGVNIGRYIIAKPHSKSTNKYVRKGNLSYVRYAVLSWQQKKKLREGSFNEGIILTDEVDEKLIYSGDISVITDEGTFSSAAILACQLKTLAGAKIVGRPAGGSFYAGNAGTLRVRLPESGLQISVNPNTYYSHLEVAEDPTAIKQPDLYLDPFILDKKDRDQFYFKHAVDILKSVVVEE